MRASPTRAAYSRFYVDRSRADEFAEKTAAAVSGMKLCHGMAEDTELGPLVSAEHLEKVRSLVQRGQEAGAEVLAGGDRDRDLEAGNFYRPTVLHNVTSSMPQAQEEIFGPVLQVLPYDDPEEVTQLANGTQYGLAASVDLLRGGANDLGGLLLDGRLAPDAGAEAGLVLTRDDVERIAQTLGRPLQQRTTGYGKVPAGA